MPDSSESDKSTIYDENMGCWDAKSEKGSEWTEIALVGDVGQDKSDSKSESSFNTLGSLSMKLLAPVSGLFTCCQGREKEDVDQPGTDLFNPYAEPEPPKEFVRDPKVDAFVGSWIAELPEKQDEMEPTDQQQCATTVLKPKQLELVAKWERLYEYWKNEEKVDRWCATEIVTEEEADQNHGDQEEAYRELHKRIQSLLRSLTSSEPMQTVLQEHLEPKNELLSTNNRHKSIYLKGMSQPSQQIAAYLNQIHLQLQLIFKKLREQTNDSWCCEQCLISKLVWWSHIKNCRTFLANVACFWDDVVVAFDKAQGVMRAVGGGDGSESFVKLRDTVVELWRKCSEAQSMTLKLMERMGEETRSVAEEMGLRESSAEETSSSFVELLLRSEWAEVEDEAIDDLEEKVPSRLSS